VTSCSLSASSFGDGVTKFQMRQGGGKGADSSDTPKMSHGRFQSTSPTPNGESLRQAHTSNKTAKAGSVSPNKQQVDFKTNSAFQGFFLKLNPFAVPEASKLENTIDRSSEESALLDERLALGNT